MATQGDFNEVHHDNDSRQLIGPAESKPQLRFVVCVGASAGGLEALENFFSGMGNQTSCAFVVVVHLSPDFKSLMPELLAKCTSMKVAAATQGTVLEPDCIYVIPPKKNLVLEDGKLVLLDRDREPGHAINLPIDIFLKSLAQDAGERAVAAILSGSGSDGSRGVRAVKEAGGLVLVEDPNSAKFDGMPRSALATGMCDHSGTPDVLGRRLIEIVGRSTFPMVADSEEYEADEVLSSLLGLLKRKPGIDLSYYKKSMVGRRVRRRMTIHGIANLESYHHRLESDADELHSLKQDLLIGVTSFFRDTEAFEILNKSVISQLLLRPQTDDQIRIWVPSCSSGEEVYSIAMLLSDAMAAMGKQRDIKIFATDVDEDALQKASRATYLVSQMVDVPPPLANRYLEKHGDLCHVIHPLREMVIFARHNLVKDAPFTRMDLVSCRNFLIYLEPDVQEQVLASLHFSLNKGGSLFLGSAESTAFLETEFDPIDSKAKLYRKIRTYTHPAARRRSGLLDPIAIVPDTTQRLRNRQTSESVHVLRTVIEQLLDSDSNSCALLSHEGAVLEVIGDPLGVFSLPKGRPTADILKLVSKEVSIAITTGLHRLRKGEPRATFAVDVGAGDKLQRLTIELRSMQESKKEAASIVFLARLRQQSGEEPVVEPIDVSETTSERLHNLEMELTQTKESLQATIEELQSTNEEQQSTNEELVASNEELQSTNEELHSVNEELYTVNAEYQKKNQELSVMTADLDNLLRSSDIGTLFLDSHLRVRKFTPAVCRVVQLLDHDIGRSISHFTHQLADDFVDDVTTVIENGSRIEKEVRDKSGRWLLMRISPYTSEAGGDEGAVITFIDITKVKNMEELTRTVNEQLEAANQKLTDQSVELEDLFSITAHDLKRPVVAMNGLLKMGISKLPDKEGTALFQSALKECEKMGRLLTDLSNVCGITKAETPEEEIDLQPWLEELISEFDEASSARNIKIHSTCDSRVIRVQRSALEQAVRNLIENAILYGSSHSEPRIDVSCQVDRGTIRLSVSDNGNGIAPEHHSRVFELFRRLEPDTCDGSGVGLVAARRMLAKVGGRLDLESSRGRGAKFTVTLATNSPQQPVMNILLVEDNSIDAEAVERYLPKSCKLTWAKTLEEARELVDKEVFNAILLDLSLSDGHGLELVTHLRTKRLSDVPVIVLSGHSQGVSEDALRTSTNGYLNKSNLSSKSLEGVIEKARGMAAL